MVNASIRANIIQQLMATRKVVMYENLLDIQKEYGALDRYWCLDILTGYSVIPQAIKLLRMYWGWLTMVAKAVG